MSDSKKSGSRDISELKQRLGLKKGAAPGPSGSTSRAQSGGVVPPPGLNLQPPPGLAPPAPAQPAIPNAHDDPFGAMNAMAAVGTVQRAPEIVIVHDGKPVENVGSGSGSIVKIIIPAVLALVIGAAIGNIGASASAYNSELAGAKAILGDKATGPSFLGLRTSLSALDSLLEQAKKSNFAPDAAMDKQLEALAAKLDVDDSKIFSTKLDAFEPAEASQVVGFYAGVAEIKQMLDDHMKAAKSDDLAIKAGKKATDAATMTEAENAFLAGGVRYGVLMSAATDTETAAFGAKLVELSPPYCNDKLSTTGKCGEGEQPSAYTYRNEPGALWSKGDFVSQGMENVPTKKVVILLPNGIRDAVIKGSEPGASEGLYIHRLKAISERTKKLLTDSVKLETTISTVANKGKRFSFFM